MPENTPLPISNGYYLSDSKIISAQQCINWYPNIVSAPALSQETLFGTVGIVSTLTTGLSSEQNRGSGVLENIPYFVNGTSLYRLNKISETEFTTDSLGTIAGSGKVSMATNGTQLCIMVPGGDGYIFTTGPDTLTTITDGDFTANGAPQIVVYVDGYFLFTTDEKKFIISNLNDGLNYTATDFGTAEADPDEIVSVVIYNNQVYIIGTVTIEGFENIGGSGFPFQRTGLLVDKGTTSAFSIANGNQAFYFVGSGKNEGPGIYQFSGASVTKISNTAIDSVLQDLSDLDLADMFAMHYGINGQFFTSFTLDNETFEYNAASGRWNQHESLISGALTAWRASSLVKAYGKIWAGDRLDGRIGCLDEDVYTEYGETIPRILDTMPFAANGNSFGVSSLELTVESGVGDFTTPDPQMRMSRSIDNKKFSDETSRSIGKVGEFEKRLIWRRQGRAGRFEMFRFEMTDPVKPVIVKLQARFKSNRR